jgi:hypothetical protein
LSWLRPAVVSVAGCLCKKTLGTAGGGLVHTVWNELGPDVTRYTINNIQFTVNHWLLQVCFQQRRRDGMRVCACA